MTALAAFDIDATWQHLQNYAYTVLRGHGATETKFEHHYDAPRAQTIVQLFVRVPPTQQQYVVTWKVADEALYGRAVLDLETIVVEGCKRMVNDMRACLMGLKSLPSPEPEAVWEAPPPPPPPVLTRLTNPNSAFRRPRV